MARAELMVGAGPAATAVVTPEAVSDEVGFGLLTCDVLALAVFESLPAEQPVTTKARPSTIPIRPQDTRSNPGTNRFVAVRVLAGSGILLESAPSPVQLRKNSHPGIALPAGG